MNHVSLRNGCYLTGEEGGELWGKARNSTGLFASLGGGLRRVNIEGIAPQGRLMDCVNRIGTRRAVAGNADLVLLDVDGAEVGSYFVADVVVEKAEPSSNGADLMDVTVTLDCEDLLPDAEWPWGLIRAGKLNRIGLWRSLDGAGRHAWLSVALNHHSFRRLSDARAGTIYEMDGRHIVDESSFYCALGEAVNGPGGYFGWNLSALDDCLCGGWGASRPFVLNWNHSMEARRRILADSNVDQDYEGRFLELVAEIFDGRGVEINLL
ncbi:barstar family protein [Streptomyces albicerus]|uniref:barstar family protein n=1 Tax=Streptomyces albicerus TaxID=2569859 RepID=UPI00124B564A|nr:barstar family protein [Streptomyces albicerus]